MDKSNAKAQKNKKNPGKAKKNGDSTHNYIVDSDANGNAPSKKN